MIAAPVMVALAVVVTSPGPPADRLGKESRRRRRWWVLAACAAVLGAVLTRSSVVVSATIAAVAAWWVWRGRSGRAARRRREAFAEALLGQVTAELRAGATMPVAMGRAAADLPENADPSCAAPIRATAAHLERGGNGFDVLRSCTVGELADIGKIWELSHVHGLPAADLLEQARRRIHARTRRAAEADANLTGPKATAVILSVLPVLGIALGEAMGARPVRLLTGGGLGGVLLVVGTVLLAAGPVWSSRIIGRAA